MLVANFLDVFLHYPIKQRKETDKNFASYFKTAQPSSRNEQASIHGSNHELSHCFAAHGGHFVRADFQPNQTAHSTAERMRYLSARILGLPLKKAIRAQNVYRLTLGRLRRLLAAVYDLERNVL